MSTFTSTIIERLRLRYHNATSITRYTSIDYSTGSSTHGGNSIGVNFGIGPVGSTVFAFSVGFSTNMSFMDSTSLGVGTNISVNTHHDTISST